MSQAQRVIIGTIPGVPAATPEEKAEIEDYFGLGSLEHLAGKPPAVFHVAGAAHRSAAIDLAVNHLHYTREMAEAMADICIHTELAAFERWHAEEKKRHPMMAGTASPDGSWRVEMEPDAQKVSAATAAAPSATPFTVAVGVSAEDHQAVKEALSIAEGQLAWAKDDLVDVTAERDGLGNNLQAVKDSLLVAEGQLALVRKILRAKGSAAQAAEVVMRRFDNEHRANVELDANLETCTNEANEIERNLRLIVNAPFCPDRHPLYLVRVMRELGERVKRAEQTEVGHGFAQ